MKRPARKQKAASPAVATATATGAVRWSSNASVLHPHERDAIESALEFPWAVNRGDVHCDSSRTLWLDAGDGSPMLLGTLE